MRTAVPDTPLVMSDPRAFPGVASASETAHRLYTLAEASLRAETVQHANAFDRELRAALLARLVADGPALAAILAGAPSVGVARHLWRTLDAAWRDATPPEPSGLAVTVFALPLVIVVGREGAGGDGVLPGVVLDPAKLAGILREYGALAGNKTFVLSNALVAAGAIDVARLPEIFAWCRLPDAIVSGTFTGAPLALRAVPPSGSEPSFGRPGGGLMPALALVPSPMEFHAGREAVHLRFLVGGAIAKPGVDLTADMKVGEWGVPLIRELVAQLGAGPASVLALPRAPQRLLPALAQGRAAQREVSAQIFASNAIRKFRSTVDEPTAVISAHRVPGASGGGELRLSLSSPFEPKAAEGFRCPLYALDRVGDVVSMLVELMRDCRVTDIRTLAGVHADRVAGTGLPLLFKPDTIPDSTRFGVH